jgi:hypothetical protein
MFNRTRVLLSSLLLFAAAAPLLGQAPSKPPELVPLIWLERVRDAPPGALPAFKSLADQPRVDQAARLADNEAARFVRSLIGRAWRLTSAHATGDLPALPIVLEQGGNYARVGYRLLRDGAIVEYPETPYLLLDLNDSSLSLTFLHEGAHVVDRIVRPGRRDPEWSALLHSTFAVTDPVTALAEGYAIHLETLWGHYGEARKSWYHRLEPQWNPERALGGEFFAPVRDLMSFSQNWARYRSVRDGEIAFEGHIHDGAYLRSQYEPARDASQLRNGNAMVASEGVVASVLFWITDGDARRAGARPFSGLNQPALADAEMRLAAALQRAAVSVQQPRPDLIDVVAAYGTDPQQRRTAIEPFVAITRGVTANPALRIDWARLFQSAVELDVNGARALVDKIDAVRRGIVDAAIADPSTLRAGVGPQLPVRMAAVTVQLKALGEPFAVEFDLNALDGAQLATLAPDAAMRARIRAERDSRPFASYADFEQRCGLTLDVLKASRVTTRLPSQ